jgi:hypothetical protein
MNKCKMPTVTITPPPPRPPRQYIRLRRYSVDSPQGSEGSENLLSLIKQYAESRGWKPGEVQRIADLEVKESFQIEELTITRTS